MIKYGGVYAAVKTWACTPMCFYADFNERKEHQEAAPQMSAVLMLHKNMIIITDYELDYNHEEGVFT